MAQNQQVYLNIFPVGLYHILIDKFIFQHSDVILCAVSECQLCHNLTPLLLTLCSLL